MAAEFPVDEAERLGALRAYRILDTPPEERFDRITRLAATIFGTPIALVSLVDGQRQWFKSRVGLNATETPREYAFCAHAILGDETLVVPDTYDDGRFRDNPLVVGGPQIRFYGGAPLITPDHRRIGTLCVIDAQPRNMSAEEEGMLRDLAQIVVDELELRIAASHLDARLQQMKLTEEIGNIGHWQFDDESGLTAASPHARRILGLDDGVVDLEALAGAFVDDDIAEVRAALSSKEKCRSRRVVAQTRATSRVVEIVVEEREIPDGSPTLVGVFQDITERESLQRRTRQAEKMATVGTLAAGVAHEINNPLSYISANAEVLSEEIAKLSDGAPLPSLDEFRELVGDIRDGSRRIHHIVQGLKTFSRSTELREELVRLPRMLAIAGRLCMNEVRHKAALVFEHSDDVAVVRGDEAQLVQVAVNLIVNAAQAIPAGASRSNRIVVRSGQSGKSSAFFEVEDTGTGMPRETIERIFEPFFTTKPPGIGTGLGLSISHGIIKALNGEIRVTSSTDKGTCIRVELPVPADLSALPSRPPVRARLTSPARILLVDDEPAVGRALGRILRPHFVVHEIDAGVALERISRGEAFDVILCDLTMPTMSGGDFYAAIAEHRPDLVNRVAFVTGGAFTPEGKAFLDTVTAPVLYKPVDSGELRATVADLLVGD